MITWTNLLALIRTGGGETVAAVADADLLNCMNMALLAVYGDLVVTTTRTPVVMVTGTRIYAVPPNFLFIQGIWDSSGRLLPDYAWEIQAGPGADAMIVFRPPFFTPTTGSNPTVAGWQASTVGAAAAAPSTYTPTIVTIATDCIHTDPGWLIFACLSATASDLSDWHKLEASDSRMDQKAERRLRDELVPTIPARYRPPANARIVPGRAE
jgi:hypothetical protein